MTLAELLALGIVIAGSTVIAGCGSSGDEASSASSAPIPATAELTTVSASVSTTQTTVDASTSFTSVTIVLVAPVSEGWRPLTGHSVSMRVPPEWLDLKDSAATTLLRRLGYNADDPRYQSADIASVDGAALETGPTIVTVGIQPVTDSIDLDDLAPAILRKIDEDTSLTVVGSGRYLLGGFRTFVVDCIDSNGNHGRQYYRIHGDVLAGTVFWADGDKTDVDLWDQIISTQVAVEE